MNLKLTNISYASKMNLSLCTKLVKMRKIALRDALREGMSEEMRHDASVFLMGEEVAEYNGAYKVSKGMLQEFELNGLSIPQ